MAHCRVCMADIVWCTAPDGEAVPLDEHEEQTQGEGRFRITEAGGDRPLCEPVAADFASPAMVDHRKICQQPRVM